MTDVMASLSVDVHPSKVKLTIFRNGNCFLIASTVSAYSLRQMILRVVADGRTASLRNVLYDRRSWRFDIAFQRIWAETYPNIWSRFHVSWWNSEVLKSLAASFERFVFHFYQYGLSGRWGLNFLCKLNIVITRLPCLFRIAKAVSSTVELVNSETFDSVNLFSFARCVFASRCFPIQLVRCADGWRRTWWQTIHMIARLPVSSIPQSKYNRHEDACLELFMSRVIPSNRTFGGYIHWSPPSIEDIL